MDFLIVCTTAFLASGLTLYSGFGLGTLLLPAFALFFPVPAAVAATGAVHLVNNLFKSSLLARDADWRTVLRFGLPAIPGAIFGAWLLGQLGESAAVFEWSAFGRNFGPTAAGVTVGLLMLAFALLELQPWFQRLSAPRRLLLPGGALTGFVGGLTGQQGALRSMFLLKTGMEPRRFIATGVMIAVIIDLSRLPTYAASLDGASLPLAGREGALLLAAGLAALAGAFLAARYLRKATIGVVRWIVAGLMLLIGAGLLTGVLGS